MEEPGFTSFMYLPASSLSVVMAISNSVPFWNTWAWSATAGLVVSSELFVNVKVTTAAGLPD